MTDIYLGHWTQQESKNDLHIYIMDEMLCLPLTCCHLTFDRETQAVLIASPQCKMEALLSKSHEGGLW